MPWNKITDCNHYGSQGAVELVYLQLCFLLTIGALLFKVWAFFTYSCSLFSCSGKARLISTLTDCKQRSSTVTKKHRTVSKKTSPDIFHARHRWERRRAAKVRNQEKGVFRRFFFEKCTPLLAVVLWVPSVLLGPLSLSICFLGSDTGLYRNPLC